MEMIPKRYKEQPALFDGECVNETDEKIIVYSGRSENLILPVIEAFVCETGIKVDTRGSSTDMALLIDEEGSKTQADVFSPDHLDQLVTWTGKAI